MSAKEIKALIEVGPFLGYSGEELKQFLTEERMQIDKEKERQEKEKWNKKDYAYSNLRKFDWRMNQKRKQRRRKQKRLIRLNECDYKRKQQKKQ